MVEYNILLIHVMQEAVYAQTHPSRYSTRELSRSQLLLCNGLRKDHHLRQENPILG
jgi:hypothetical protein